MFWTALGVALIVRRGLSLKNLDRQTQGSSSEPEAVVTGLQSNQL
jgi:hypothetical protein